jgi:hypothetical protein
VADRPDDRRPFPSAPTNADSRPLARRTNGLVQPAGNDPSVPAGDAPEAGRARVMPKMPPRVPPPPARPGGARPVATAGVITTVSTGTDRRRTFGLRVLLAVAGPAGVIVSVVAVRNGERSILLVVGPLLVLAAIAGIRHRFRLWREDRDRRGMRLMPAAGDLEVRRFRVTAFDGDTTDWVLYGRPRGGDLATGDIVRLRGRRQRDGRAVTARVELLGTPAGPLLRVVTGHRPLRFLVVRFLSVAGYCVSGVIALGTLLVVLGVVR